MRILLGCTVLIGAALVGALLSALAAQWQPGYVDRHEAILIGLATARQNCRTESPTPATTCLGIRFVSADEGRNRLVADLSKFDEAMRSRFYWSARRNRLDVEELATVRSRRQ